MSVREMIPGRPFRFLYLVLCLWFVSRAAAWVLDAVETNSTTAARAEKPHLALRKDTPEFHTARRQPVSVSGLLPARAQPHPFLQPVPQRQERFPVLAAVRSGHIAPTPPGEGVFGTPPDGSIALPPPSQAAGAKPDRWSLSAWLLYRPDNAGAHLANAGQLGGSQAGARLAYDLTPSAAYALAIHGRVSAALAKPAQAEGAMGITLRPVRTVPVAFSVERRFNIGEGGRDAFAAYAAGGLNPTPILAGLELEGYGQAGIVGASRTDAFADGRISISKTLIAAEKAMQITAGLALSGGAQPSLSRLDIGPHLSARFPLGHSHARIAVEWRERIAGNARPSSGPAIVLATDF